MNTKDAQLNLPSVHRPYAESVDEELMRLDPEELDLEVNNPTWERQLVEAVRGSLRQGRQVSLVQEEGQFSPQQVAEMLGVHRATVSRKIAAGEIRATKVGAHHRIPVSEVHRLQQQTATAKPHLEDEGGRPAQPTALMEGTSAQSHGQHITYCGDNAEIMPRLSPGFDVAFFDPPYNTNRGPERHSYRNRFTVDEWAAQTKHRLELTWSLLAENAVLIVTIDERSLGQMLTIVAEVTNTPPQIVSVRTLRSGTYRPGFRRTGEFYLFVHKGQMTPLPQPLGPEWGLTGRTPTGLASTAGAVRWNPLFRSGADNAPASAPGCVYPVWVQDGRIAQIDGPQPHPGAEAIWPTNGQGRPGRWRLRPEKAQSLHARGLMKLGKTSSRGRTPVYYVPAGQVAAFDAGFIVSEGLDDQGAHQLRLTKDRAVLPGTNWDVWTHDYGTFGSQLLRKLVPDTGFTHAKSVYAVADTLRMYPARKVLDVYAGSGTTAHAVMMLNQADGGRRESVSISLDEGGEYHRTLVPRLKAATTVPLVYRGVLEGYTGVMPGTVLPDPPL